MTTDSSGTDTTECNKDPAPQPHGQQPDAKCEKPPYDKKPPDICPKIKQCEPACNGPSAPKPDEPCLDDLIREHAATALLGEEAKKSKAELEGILAKMRTASAKYTPEAYPDLKKRWQDNDKLIVSLIGSLICRVPCWWCVIEWEVCPLLYAIVEDERKLKGTDKLYETANSLYDQRYWWWREREIQSEALERVNKVMAAWMDPFTTLDGLLKSINTEVSAAGASKLLGPDLHKMMFDLFFKWIPQHLAIAPPVDIATTTIPKKYVDICQCEDARTADDCCGPNIGPLTVRERLVGPLPFLIPPELYPKLICCLASHAYRPAKAAYAAAAAKFAAVDSEIEALKTSIAARLKNLPTDAKIRLGKPIDCKDYQPKSNGGGTNNGGGGGNKCCDDATQGTRPRDTATP